MKLKSIVILFLLAASVLLFSPTDSSAQGAVPDSSFYQKALLNAFAQYHHAFGNQSALYNGSNYGEYLFRFTEGSPFFNSQIPVAGTINYDGIVYDSIVMRYDEVKDVVVINSGPDHIQLTSGKIHAFNLYGSDFIRIEKDSLTNELVNSGFYNLLYRGKISLLKKQVKTVREVISSTAELQHFADEKNHYYILKDGRAYPIRSRKDITRLFGDHKKEVQQFIKANDLSFRNDKQKMLTKTTAYYDGLKK
ncbi:MAG: hypothetical protein ABIQ31_11410 [Ferruginibacter sp.]